MLWMSELSIRSVCRSILLLSPLECTDLAAGFTSNDLSNCEASKVQDACTFASHETEVTADNYRFPFLSHSGALLGMSVLFNSEEPYLEKLGGS